LSGQELKATVRLDGPVAPLTAETGNDLQSAIDAWEKEDLSTKKTASDKVAQEVVVDFEHLNVKDEFDAANDNDDDDELMKLAKTELSPDARKRIKDKQRKKILVKRQKQEQQRLHQHRKVREEGQPWQSTVKVPTAGWYRLCVTGTFHQVRVYVEKQNQLHWTRNAPMKTHGVLFLKTGSSNQSLTYLPTLGHG
jgi:hypothetical protein